MNFVVKITTFRSVKTELEDLEYAHLPNIESEEDLGFSNLGRDQSHSNSRQRIVTRRRGLRSTRSTDAIENNCSNNPGTTPKSNRYINFVFLSN